MSSFTHLCGCKNKYGYVELFEMNSKMSSNLSHVFLSNMFFKYE